MSRFADTGATRTVPLGPCECPGTPHDHDEFTIRSQLAGPEIEQFAATRTPEETAEALAGFITGWNLLGPDGSAWEANAEHILLLLAPTLSAIVGELQKVIAESSAVPNGSGAPSRASSRRSASPSPTKIRTPTT